MKKKTIALAASMVALAGVAHADVELNIYGASAQATLWNAIAPSFLASLGCNGGNASAVAKGTNENSSGKFQGGISVGSGCGNYGTITLRYQGKNSLDGIAAADGKNILDNGNSCAATERKVQLTAGAKTLGCKPVHLGASDAAGSSFTQGTSGNKTGPVIPATGRVDIAPSYNGYTTDLATYRPVVVPFGFFVNNGVKVKKCVGGTDDGMLCTATTDCGGTGASCNTVQLDNVTREMAVNIFSGNALAWTDFGQTFSVDGDPSATIYSCLRHAGSGTHATLDKAVMNSTWGAALLGTESATTFFNDASGDMMACIDKFPGAIGYADADQAVSAVTHAVKYNGVPARRNTIRNGQYDFFSFQWLYEKANTTADEHNLIVALNDFASNPDNVTTAPTSLGSKAKYWATANEMVYGKPSDDSFPIWQGATTTVTP
jgi:hypothetical protein